MERRVTYGADRPFTTLNKWQAGALWRDAREAIGLKDDVEFVFHVATRHEGLSRIADTGASAFTLKTYSGHKSIAAADRYVKPSLDSLRMVGASNTRSVDSPDRGNDAIQRMPICNPLHNRFAIAPFDF